MTPRCKFCGEPFHDHVTADAILCAAHLLVGAEAQDRRMGGVLRGR